MKKARLIPRASIGHRAKESLIVDFINDPVLNKSPDFPAILET
ncbi:type I restriction endonuclease, partial [Neisseria meningitidis]